MKTSIDSNILKVVPAKKKKKKWKNKNRNWKKLVIFLLKTFSSIFIFDKNMR